MALPADTEQADALLARLVGIAALFGADDDREVADVVRPALPDPVWLAVDGRPAEEEAGRRERWLRGLCPAVIDSEPRVGMGPRLETVRLTGDDPRLLLEINDPCLLVRVESAA